MEKVTADVEKKHDHTSAGTVAGIAAGVAAGVAGAIAIKEHHDDKTKKDAVRQRKTLSNIS